MAQTSGRPCPACGTIVPTGQRFCTNCGTDIHNVSPANQPSQYGGVAEQNPVMQQVPPYAQSPNAQQQYNPLLDQQQQQSNTVAEVLGALGLLFFMRRYRPGYRARRQSHGACGCLFMIVILLIVLGIIGFVVSASQSRLTRAASARLYPTTCRKWVICLHAKIFCGGGQYLRATFHLYDIRPFNDGVRSFSAGTEDDGWDTSGREERRVHPAEHAAFRNFIAEYACGLT